MKEKSKEEMAREFHCKPFLGQIVIKDNNYGKEVWEVWNKEYMQGKCSWEFWQGYWKENSNNERIEDISTNKKDDNIYLELDSSGRCMSDLASDTSDLLSNKNILFLRPSSRKIVEVIKTKNVISSFSEISDKRFITLVEKYAKVGYWKTSREGEVFEIKSLSPVKASTILESQILEDSLPQILRIFSSPIPIIHNNKLTFPIIGYDKRFSSWRNNKEIEINKEMELGDAKIIIDKIYSEFCFKKEQDRVNAISALITPFIRGLFKKFNTNTPAYLYLGNREGVGKDYCASIPALVIEGQFQQDSPISTGSKVDNDELRKKITSAMRSGRSGMHFANNNGYLNSAVLEKLLTDPFWVDRILSKNEEVIYPNEMNISLSGNIPIRYTDDLERRMIFVNLFYSQEDINARKFNKSDLHGWILKNRSKILSALFCLVKEWYNNGCKNGSAPFASFPEWANIVGGILENAGYENPCVKDGSNKILTGDSDSDEIKELYLLCFKKYPNRQINKSKIMEIIKENDGLFGYVDWQDKGHITKFYIKFRKYIGREFNNIRMDVFDINVRTTRQEFIFKMVNNEEKDGHLGHLGTVQPIRTYSNNNNIQSNRRVPHVTKVTK